ncbi:ABC transporter ATP-binding protein [Gloeothece verrucosa]|uniref:ABC transporter related protein n=1 Tax=Gloeothece verrucosa (strain PCC 7822) TaxID=497965 RepID=E0UL18_GLOV7|nr:ABC transporter ATP-binding protein [Gloeothece verrucosa]ADN17648.1 ABC transporter related protein [Gloeothece verrucosa PCC 7822]
MSDIIIVDQVGKRYRRYHESKPRTIMEAALAGFRKLKAIEEFWALRHISFTVAPGEMVGIIGQNGAGKSTLLQLIGGVGRVDEGRIKIKGKIGALLDLGAGFSSDLTGRENVFVSGVVAGLTRGEVARRLDDIVAFAELEESIDNPVRTYSTGMMMRLAFATAIHTEPDILLIDEFLSVGDLAFQGKCLERIAHLKAQGCAIVLVSHSTDQVQELCDQVLWLRHGVAVAYGTPEVIIGQYVSEMRTETISRTPERPPQLTKSGLELRVNENRFGSLEVEITDVRLLPSAKIESGEPLFIEIDYLCSQALNNPIFGVTISREDHQVCFETSTASQQKLLTTIQGQGTIKLAIDRLDLIVGQYYIDVGIYESNWSYAYDYHWHVYYLTIEGMTSTQGFLNPPHVWKVETHEPPEFNKLVREKRYQS